MSLYEEPYIYPIETQVMYSCVTKELRTKLVNLKSNCSLIHLFYNAKYLICERKFRLGRRGIGASCNWE